MKFKSFDVRVKKKCERARESSASECIYRYVCVWESERMYTEQKGTKREREREWERRGVRQRDELVDMIVRMCAGLWTCAGGSECVNECLGETILNVAECRQQVESQSRLCGTAQHREWQHIAHHKFTSFRMHTVCLKKEAERERKKKIDKSKQHSFMNVWMTKMFEIIIIIIFIVMEINANVVSFQIGRHCMLWWLQM